jgi:predicted ABC-type exoprotein transport system permease subunit
MMGILRMEFARAFINKRFLVVLLLALACFAYGYYDAGHFFPGMGNNSAGNVTQDAYELWLFVHFRSFFCLLFADCRRAAFCRLAMGGPQP